MSCGRRRRRDARSAAARGSGVAGVRLSGALGVGLSRGWALEHARGMRKALVAMGWLLGVRTGLVAERGGASSPASGVVRLGMRYGLR